MEGALRRSLGSQAQHTHSLEDHTWSIQQSTTTHTKHIHNIQHIVPIPKPNKDTNKGTSYRPISLLSVIADTGEEPSSLHNSKHTKHAHATRVQNTTFYSDGTTHTKHRSKRVQPNGSPCANNHCSTRYEQSFRHNKHTHTNQKAATDKTFQAQSLSSSQTTSRDAKPTQHIEITHPNNVNLKLAFHKVASFHPHYSTFTPQTYHHPVHRFRSWPMQMTSQSHPHTQVRVQPRNTYNHTYTKFLPGQNKTTSY